jgi:hypothetical protein
MILSINQIYSIAIWAVMYSDFEVSSLFHNYNDKSSANFLQLAELFISQHPSYYDEDDEDDVPAVVSVAPVFKIRTGK